jgi:hypothetical protein
MYPPVRTRRTTCFIEEDFRHGTEIVREPISFIAACGTRYNQEIKPKIGETGQDVRVCMQYSARWFESGTRQKKYSEENTTRACTRVV